MMKEKMVFALSVILLWGVIFSGIAVAVSPKCGGTFTTVIGTNPDTLDSDQTRLVEAAEVVNENVVQGLVHLNAKLEVVPGLAESWKALDGGKSWEFYLRKGVKFHDGSDFDADVVKWNFDRGLDPKIGWSGRPSFDQVIESYQVVDKHTFRINLKRRMGAFIRTPFLWVSHGKMIQSRQAVEKYGKDYSRNPVGTGPFKFVEWIDYDHITLARNEGYWEKGLPYLDKVIYKITPDVNVRIQALRAGEIDLIRKIPRELISLIKADPNIKYVESKNPVNTEYIIFNCKKKPFDDVRVRQAFGFAINRKEIVDLLLPGMAIPDANFVANGDYFYHDTKFFNYDPERAKRLLKEAGYEKLTCELMTNTSYPRFAPEAQLLKEQLAKAGIEVNIKLLDKGAFWKNVFGGAFDVLLEDWETSEDPNTHIGVNTMTASRYNAYGYGNPKFDELMSEALIPSDPVQRKKIYDQAQDLLVRDAPQINIFHLKENAGMRKSVMGFENVPIANNFQAGYYIWLDK